jgi:hypothetical protein
MKALIDQLHEEGFSSTQIKESLFVIEDWVEWPLPYSCKGLPDRAA